MCSRTAGGGEDVPVFETRDGKALHLSVPPSRWCITRDDLRQFRRIVWQAVRSGRMVAVGDNTRDLWLDNSIGPSIAAVTRQLIAPITEQYGRASWALMLHPQGLECDLFVTHSWSEGTFEFIDKVLHSWPGSARHAYCCMLSNPQNLDIGSLLESPENSPFAQALRAARYTLVVPNGACSVYTRIWCIYEAYLSTACDKPIFTATKQVGSIWPHVGCTTLICIAGAGGKLAVCYLGFRAVDVVQEFILLVLLGFCLAGTLMMKSACALLVVNNIGAALCGILSGFCIQGLLSDMVVGFFVVVPASAAAVFYFLGGVIFACREADRLWDQQAELDATQLLQGYTGKLQDAQASVETDRQRILGEIQARQLEGEVEDAISVLIGAGMSTPGLRQAAARGVDISGAGLWSLAMVGGVCLMFICHPASHAVLNSSCTGRWRWVPWVKTAEGVAWAVLFKLLGPDSRGLAASAGVVLGVLPYFTVWFLWVSVSLATGTLDRNSNCVPDALGVCVWGPLMLVTSALGVGGCASLPGVGPALTRLLVRRGVAIKHSSADGLASLDTKRSSRLEASSRLLVRRRHHASSVGSSGGGAGSTRLPVSREDLGGEGGDESDSGTCSSREGGSSCSSGTGSSESSHERTGSPN